MAVLIIVGAACAQGQRNSSSPMGRAAREADLAQRLVNAIDGDDRWRRFWTLSEKQDGGAPAKHNGEITVAVTEGSTLAALCAVESRRCGLLSWSSGGNLQVQQTLQSSARDLKALLEESTRLVTGWHQDSNVVTGDLSMPKNGQSPEAPFYGRTFNRFTMTVTRPPFASYLDLYRRYSLHDHDLAEASKQQATEFRGSGCSKGSLSVPWVVQDDPYAYVFVELGGSCERGFFLWRRNNVSSWTFEQFIVAKADIDFLLPKFRRLRHTVIGLPRASQ